MGPGVVAMRTDGVPQRFAFASALTGAVLEIQNVLAARRSTTQDDIGFSRSLSGVVKASTQVSAFDLQRFAKSRLAAIRADGQAAPTARALGSFDFILRNLVFDNGPTPQVGSTPSGSVEIQWLVNGNLVSALFDEEGSCYLLALNSEDKVLLDEEVGEGDLPDQLRAKLSERLQVMSHDVVERPTFWSMSGARR